MASIPDSDPKVSRPGTDPANTAESEHTTSEGDRSTNAEASSEPDTKDAPDRYAVGYCRPPLATRFKRGQSRNRKGRQKQSRGSRKVIQQVLDEQIRIREGGRLRRMSKFEALVRTTLNRAFEGDPKAMTSLLVLVRHCGYGAEQEQPAAELMPGSDPKAIIDDYVRRYATEVQAASKPTTAQQASAAKPSVPPAPSPKETEVRRP